MSVQGIIDHQCPSRQKSVGIPDQGNVFFVCSLYPNNKLSCTHTLPLHTPTHTLTTCTLPLHTPSTHSPYIYISQRTSHTLHTFTTLNAIPLHTSHTQTPPPPPPPHTHTHTPLSYTEEKYIVLESLMYPGQHVAVLPDGTVKNPKNSHTGLHARFVPIAMETVSLQTSSHVMYTPQL